MSGDDFPTFPVAYAFHRDSSRGSGTLGKDSSFRTQMAQHFTRNTVAAQAWCLKCNKQTMHRVDDRRIGPCMECIAELERKHDAVKDVPKETQRNLFQK